MKKSNSLLLLVAIAALLCGSAIGGGEHERLIAQGFVAIPGGTFIMGSPEGEPGRESDESPQHTVTVSGFFMGKYEVTQAEWIAVMDTNPSGVKDSNLSVDRVSWYDAVIYCNKRSLKEGLKPCYSADGEVNPDKWRLYPRIECDFTANGYRLPTEAEWEYACRAGTTTMYYAKNYYEEEMDPNQLDPSGTGFGEFPGNIPPENPWGLYYMHENVYEWCWDWYGSYGGDAVTDPAGALFGDYHVIRGGIYNGIAMRSADRGCNYPDYKYATLGFRVVCRP